MSEPGKRSMLERYRNLWRAEPAQLIDDELKFHLEMRIAEAEARGMDATRARELALQRFGNFEEPRSECLRIARRKERRVARTEFLGEVRQDAAYAIRALGRAPGMTVAAVLTIGLGVAATTVVLSLINSLLLRPLPVANPDALYNVNEQRTGWVSSFFGQTSLKAGRFDAYREATSKVFAGMAADRPRHFALRTSEGALPVEGALVAGDYFGLLGLRPAAGRFFVGEDERAVVIGHRLWRTRFGGRDEALGSTIWLDGRPLNVIGVAPRGFGGVRIGPEAEVWVPARAYQSLADSNAPQRELTLLPFGRLAPGIDVTQANAMVSVVARRTPPDEAQTEVQGARLEQLKLLPAGIRGPVVGFFGMLLGTAALVLLIASANIAGMLLARGVARQRELAVRLAVGAGRARLVRQLLTETLALFMLGGAVGCVLALWGAGAAARIPMPFDGSLNIDFSPDWGIYAVSLAATACVGLLFGLAPALRSSRVNLVPALKAGGTQGATRATRGRNVFVASQLAMAVMLLVITGLFVRSLQQALSRGPGFEADNVVVASVDLGAHDYGKQAGEAFYSALLARMSSLPDVESVGFGAVVMLTGERESSDLQVVDSVAGGQSAALTAMNFVDDGYMRALRIPIVSGRALEASDREGAVPAVIVNELLAERLWPNSNPLGRRVTIRGATLEVVGVAANGSYTVAGESPQPFAFIHRANAYLPSMSLHVRTRPGASVPAVIESIREAVREIDSDVAVEDARALPQLIRSALFPQRFAAVVIGIFGLTGVVLAGLGVYSVLAFHVAQRTREIGIRVALGARKEAILRSVLFHGARLAVLGGLVGLLFAAGTGRLLRGFLLGLSPRDPLTFAVVPVLLIVVALTAAYIPARRATRIDPVEALRLE